MKKLGKTVLILVIIFFLSAIAGGVVFLLSNNFLVYTTGNLEIVNLNDVYETSLLDIQKINVNSISTDVEVILVNSSGAKFELVGYYSEGRYNESPKLEIEGIDGKINVEIFYPLTRLTLGMARHRMNLKVYLPENYSGELDLYTVSGDVFVNDFNLENLWIETVSGDVKGDNLNVDYIKTISGDIELEDLLIGGDLEIRTVSGDVDLDCSLDSSFFVEFESVSGDFHGEEFEGENKVFVKTTSGDFSISKD